MAVGYTRQSSGLIVTSATIQASHFNNEYDKLQAAFDATTGHNHDGTTGGGAAINIATTTGTLPITAGGTGATTAANARTALGLAIGTNVQAYDAQLTDLAAITTAAGLVSLAGLTTAADKGIYTTASNTYATYDLTSFGRTLANSANAAAARTTLGTIIGTDVLAYSATVAYLDVSQSWTRQQAFTTATLTDAATVSWNCATAQVAKVTLGGNRAFAAPTNQKNGGVYILRLIQDGSGGHTAPTWDSVFKFPNGVAPTLTGTAGATDIITFVSDGTNMYASGLVPDIK